MADRPYIETLSPALRCTAVRKSSHVSQRALPAQSGSPFLTIRKANPPQGVDQSIGEDTTGFCQSQSRPVFLCEFGAQDTPQKRRLRKTRSVPHVIGTDRREECGCEGRMSLT